MARPPNSPQFAPPAFHQAIRARFIEFARIHNAEGLLRLGTDVWTNALSLKKWTTIYNVGGTWVEDWAEDTIAYWSAGNFPPIVSAEGVTLRYPPPRLASGDEFSFSFSATSATSGSKEQCGITLGGFMDNESNEVAAFRQRAHDRLDVDLDAFFGRNSAIIPNDLRLKIATAALYVLGRKTREELAVLLKETHVSAEGIRPWLEQIMPLLKLPMKPRGRRRDEEEDAKVQKCT